MDGMGVDVPPKVKGAPRYVLSAGFVGKEREKSRKGRTRPVSYFELGASMKRPDLHNGGLRFQ